MLDMIVEKTQSPSNLSIIKGIKQLHAIISDKQCAIKEELKDVKRIKEELSILKEGSVAKIEQIRTISKMRVYNPRGKKDPLYGIRFSKPTMQKINEKLKEIFVFDE